MELKKLKRIAIIGNPNVGKSTIFNALTGLVRETGNWSGVTVDKNVYKFAFNNQEVELIDLPGIYSIYHNTAKDALETIQCLLSKDYDLVINIISSMNLERHLQLTLQLLERKIPVAAVLSMEDLAKRNNIIIDEKKLGALLGIDVIKINALDNHDIERLKAFLCKASDSKDQDLISKIFLSQTQEMIFIEQSNSQTNIDKAEALKGIIEKNVDGDVISRITQERDGYIRNILSKVKKEAKTSSKYQDFLDAIFLNHYLGPAIFLFLMFLMFTVSVTLGGIFKDPFELVTEALVIDFPMKFGSALFGYPSKVFSVIINALGGGIVTVAGFIPVIFSLYLVLSFFEESGYIARAAYVINGLMQKIGLSGKAFFPLIVGFGCNVSSIMAARILDRKNERVIVAMMAPFMSCGARLSVYALFVAAFFPNGGFLVVFFLYLIGILIGVLTGFIIKLVLGTSDTNLMLIELPDYNLPKITMILKKAYSRTKDFALSAGKLIVITFFILQILSNIKPNLQMAEEGEESIVEAVGKSIHPIFTYIGAKEENWQSSVAILTGIFAKEIIVGTLNSLYMKPVEPDEEKDLSNNFKLAFYVLLENLYGLFDTSSTSLITSLIDVDKVKANLSSKEGVVDGIYEKIIKGFDGNIGAFSYLIFVLLYFPCISVFATIAREIGLKWAWFSAIWSTSVAYITAFSSYFITKLIIKVDTFLDMALAAAMLMLVGGFVLYVNHKKHSNKATLSSDYIVK